MPDISIVRTDTASKARYEARVDGIEEPAELTISKVSDVLIIADHTYAPETMRGMGVAAASGKPARLPMPAPTARKSFRFAPM